MSEKCSFCSGSGKMKCQGCNGTGITIRKHPTELWRDEQIPCPNCRGTGKVSCNICGGSGRRY